jgi:hypothetical protein
MEILIAAASSTSACAFARLAPAVASSSTRRAAAAPRGVSSSHPNFSSASRHATNPAGSAPTPTTAATTAGRSSLAFLPPGIRVVAAAAENIGDDASLSFSLHSAEDVSVPVHATPSSSSVSRRRLVAASMTMMTLAGVQAAAAAVVGEGDGEEDEEDDEAAQAALVASMNSVLKAYSGEMSYPLQTAFDGASASSATLMRTSFEVSSLWDVPPVTTLVSESAANGAKSTATWSTIMDPVNGKVVTGAVVTVTKGFAKQKITDLGKPENVSVAKVLGLDGDDSYRRADMLGGGGSASTFTPPGELQVPQPKPF